MTTEQLFVPNSAHQSTAPDKAYDLPEEWCASIRCNETDDMVAHAFGPNAATAIINANRFAASPKMYLLLGELHEWVGSRDTKRRVTLR